MRLQSLVVFFATVAAVYAQGVAERVEEPAARDAGTPAWRRNPPEWKRDPHMRRAEALEARIVLPVPNAPEW
ncbi:hypothetical protein B0H19DRAFT_1263877 [Mycena capillaripes]|nr:hypothetical protein B0H19DRAFT_1263877 [Mycena capillaripes]